MNKLTYSIHINAHPEHVFDQMLGLTNIASYQAWTKAFNPTSTYLGKWEEGAKILFVGTSEDGKVAGMVSHVKSLKTNEFSSIEHYGMYHDGTEILEGPEIDAWKGSHENYRFSADNNGTLVEIELDSVPEFEDYFNSTWPAALELLKARCEA